MGGETDHLERERTRNAHENLQHQKSKEATVFEVENAALFLT